MNSYSKLVEVIGQKRAIIDKLKAELAPLEEVLVLLEKDFDELSILRLKLHSYQKEADSPVPLEPEIPTAPQPKTAPAPKQPPQSHVSKQQQIFDALAEPLTLKQLEKRLPGIKSLTSSLQVLRAKNVVEAQDSSKRPLKYQRVNGVTGVPKTLPGKPAAPLSIVQSS